MLQVTFGIFNCPVFFRQFCVVYVIFMGKRFGVVVESLNKFSGTPKFGTGLG